MKAISLWQPYASFMGIDLKRNETRGWSTKFRGDLAICSAKRPMKKGEFGQVVDNLIWEHRYELTATMPQDSGWSEAVPVSKLLPCGFVICVVEVYDCMIASHAAQATNDEEYALGNYDTGRFAWLTRNCRRLKEPIPVTGKQGFFNLPCDIVEKIKAQLT